VNLYFRLNIQTKDSNMKRYIYLYIFLYTLYTLFILKSSSRYYFIFIRIIIVLNAQTKIHMMQWFICVLIRIYSFLNMSGHM
jgi:hypothetical protein